MKVHCSENGELIKIATRNGELFSKVERVREGKPALKSSHQNKTKKMERNANFTDVIHAYVGGCLVSYNLI